MLLYDICVLLLCHEPSGGSTIAEERYTKRGVIQNQMLPPHSAVIYVQFCVLVVWYGSRFVLLGGKRILI